MPVVDIDRGMKETIRALEFMDVNVVDVGLLVDPDGPGITDADTIMIDDEGNQNEERLTVGNVGGFHEFGMGVPERSFVRATFDNETLKIEGVIVNEIAKVLEGRKVEIGMANMGIFAASEMQFTIEASKGIKPLSRQRLDQKRAIGTPSTPLINWGIMIDSLRYKVHRG